METKRLTDSGRSRHVTRGVVGGALAGAFFLGIAMWFATTTGQVFYRPLELISSLVLDPATTSTMVAIALGAAIHAGLSVAFGAVFGAISPILRTNRAVLGGAVAYGALLYFVNFIVFPQWVEIFNQFDASVGPLVFSLHVLYGLVLAAPFLAREVPYGEAQPATLTQREREEATERERTTA